MKIEQLYTNCLAQGAYFISSDGEAAVIDPIREPDVYLKLAKASGSRIKYIFETHFHADFVSGHLELAEKTGATIVYGPTAVTAFEAYIGQDEETFCIGKLRLKLLHTPGHTLESSCYLLEDETGTATTIFTGDTLFIGDVGRPDLAQQPKEGLTQDELAGMLFDSLRDKIMPLNDDIVVYPAHGAGSACGKNMSKETWDTLGNQRLNNYALNINLSRDQFIAEVTAGLPPPPAYFPINVRLNSQGYTGLQDIIRKGTRALMAGEFEQEARKEHTLILDTRDPADFAAGHIPGSVNIGLNGSFATWAGALLPYENAGLLIVANSGKETEVITRLARVGFDNVTGYLLGGFEGWQAAGKTINKVPNLSAAEFFKLQAKNKFNIIDVRAAAEFEQGHLAGATNLPLGNFHQLGNVVDKPEAYYVYCAGGYRSMIYISMLKAAKNIELINVNGGYGALKLLINA
ncbi:MBL fold metallo-hydrolase [Mucilaginibacter mali]|uniref:MBL fold metallo-hydrolase n=1 Tax=Mucilaginibacter mali TaxID=2740462 RepID=A0A7D4Q704_9SPHI|nr:rhodanese-like domain-containing protein [Mucilaginibacter mali]QKJ32607.1 MBL fold metallo-hydrolase [Mucilaginibacter mali]